MRRREFISVIAGAAVWPLRARAEQPAMRMIGYLTVGAVAGAGHMIAMSNGGRLIGAQCHADALASEIVNISNRPPIPLRTQPLAVQCRNHGPRRVVK